FSAWRSSAIHSMLEFSCLCVVGLVLGSVGVAALFVVSTLTPWKRRTRKEMLSPVFVYAPHNDNPVRTFLLLFKNFFYYLNYKKTPFHRLLTEKNERPFATDAQLYLSVIIPAMNEEKRLPIMLNETLSYLSLRNHQNPDFTFEVIIVDDGSTDDTANTAAIYGRRHEGLVHVLKLEENRGKGGAVRAGVLHARGRLILFADADGATQFEDLEKLEKSMKRLCGGDIDETFPALVVGSRAHLESESVATRSFFRTILMMGFHALVWLFAVRSVKDTQCGFKLFTRGAAARIFPVMHVERWAFDVEILYLAEMWKLKVDEVAVVWHEVDGSKIVPVWSWLEMGRDLILIWFRYTVGIWKPEVLEN
ncbi:algn-5, partial [Pristionchus pacificus]